MSNVLNAIEGKIAELSKEMKEKSEYLTHVTNGIVKMNSEKDNVSVMLHKLDGLIAGFQASAKAIKDSINIPVVDSILVPASEAADIASKVVEGIESVIGDTSNGST